MRAIFALAILLSGRLANAGGGDVVGNPGGGLCYADHCLTLAEAGFRVATPDEPFWILPPDTAKALNQLIDGLPVANYAADMVAQTVGTGENFIALAEADPQKVEELRRKYADLLKQSGSSINPEDVKIFAFARAVPIGLGYYEYRNETYLLPEFFKLTPVQQAKVLIHERNVRGDHHEHFLQALELDGYIEDLSQDPARLYKNDYRIERWFEQLDLFYSSDYYDSTAFANWLAWYLQSRNIVFEVEKFCGESWPNCVPDAAKISANYAITPGFLRFIQKKHAILTHSRDPLEDQSDVGKKFFADARQWCEAHQTGAESYLLYPYNFFGPGYHLTLLYCRTERDRDFNPVFKVDAYLFEYRGP